MKNNIIIFGAGHYGVCAYHCLCEKYNIKCFADNSADKKDTQLYGLPVIPGNSIIDIYDENVDIVVCIRDYSAVTDKLFQEGIADCYVMTEGFLYYYAPDEPMIPIELFSHTPYISDSKTKSILYLQNKACIRTHKIASIMKRAGYDVFHIFTKCPPVEEYEAYRDIYKDMWHFTSVNGIIDFIDHSDFDVIHCSNEPDILANTALQTKKPVVVDTHDMQSLRSDVDIETMALEYISNCNANGNLYTSNGVVEIAKNKFNLEGHELLSIENMMEKQHDISGYHKKMSSGDKEIHCVYEGAIVGGNKDSHRYFEDMWLKIASNNIHIHFYSQSDEEYCKKLDEKSEYLHYEGNHGGTELIEELTQYDCGLALFNVNKRNKAFLETGTANKVFEYLNAGLPVIVTDIKSYVDFVTKYNAGIKLDLSGDIKKQLEEAINIKIERDFLDKHGFTMESRKNEIVDFYERVMIHKK